MTGDSGICLSRPHLEGFMSVAISSLIIRPPEICEIDREAASLYLVYQGNTERGGGGTSGSLGVGVHREESCNVRNV